MMVFLTKGDPGSKPARENVLGLSNVQASKCNSHLFKNKKQKKKQDVYSNMGIHRIMFGIVGNIVG